MLRKLLLLLCFLNTQHVFSQKKPVSQKHQKQALSVPPRIGDYKEIGSVLPPFILGTPAGKRITNDDVRSESNFLVMVFNPFCGHCEDQTDSLIKYMDLFKETKILMLVHPNTAPMMPLFIQGHHVDKYPKMIIGIDSLIMSDRIFLEKGLPQLNVYNKDRKLIKVFPGGAPIDSLRPYIQ